MVSRIRGLLPSLALNDHLRDALQEDFRGVGTPSTAADRRRGQFALLEERPAAQAQPAQDLADTFDAFERRPGRAT